MICEDVFDIFTHCTHNPTLECSGVALHYAYDN